MKLDTVFCHNSKCPVRPIGDGLVIMAPNGYTTHSLEDLGAFIWNQIDGKRDLQAILEAVLAEYDVDQETACADLLFFISQIEAADLIVTP
jgi:Coenzyme PQQ synthesis protein D (PqqD)